MIIAVTEEKIVEKHCGKERAGPLLKAVTFLKPSLSYRNKTGSNKGRHLVSCSGLHVQVHRHTCMHTSHIPHKHTNKTKQNKTPKGGREKFFYTCSVCFPPKCLVDTKEKQT